MATHVSDWGDLLNQCQRGGKRNTMVMMFVGGVVLMLDRIPVLFYYRKATGREFFVPAQTLIVVKLLKGHGRATIIKNAKSK